ncbi:MAG: 5-(carboxyamino)imidazole ribonucleotide synthase [Myxococcota bacterium]
MTFRSHVVTPPVLGIFGGGQLGRMTCVAAQALGYAVRVLDPDPHCPAATSCNELITAAFDDVIAAQRLALGCAAVTVDLEAVGLDAMRAAATHAPVRPSAEVLHVIQDRARQRAWLQENGFPIPDVRRAENEEALRNALEGVGRPAFVKATQGGYDGKGQVRVVSDEDADEAAALVRQCPVVVEENVDFLAEISVQIARRPGGEMRAFAPALNHHEQQILAWTMLPAPIDADVAARAIDLGKSLAERLDVVGLLTVELFLLKDGSLRINELAPRPHNSFHTTLGHARVSQFAQLARAVLDLPLAEPTEFPTIVVANLLGELWDPESGTLDVASALAEPGVDVTVYGKRVARLARKMGHLTATADSPEKALAAARAAMERLGRTLAPSPLVEN